MMSIYVFLKKSVLFVLSLLVIGLSTQAHSSPGSVVYLINEESKEVLYEPINTIEITKIEPINVSMNIKTESGYTVTLPYWSQENAEIDRDLFLSGTWVNVSKCRLEKETGKTSDYSMVELNFFCGLPLIDGDLFSIHGGYFSLIEDLNIFLDMKLIITPYQNSRITFKKVIPSSRNGYLVK